MQAEAMEGDNKETGHANIKGRAVYYLSAIHSRQAGRSKDYSCFWRSFQITICGYTILPERQNFVNRFLLRNEEDVMLSNAICVVTIELSKLKEAYAKPVAQMTPLEQWAAFFDSAHEPKKKKLLEELMSAREGIKVAAEILMNISQDPDQQALFLARHMAYMDKEHSKAVQRKEEERRLREVETAKNEGKNEEKNMIAKKMLLDGKPIDEIVKYTGLTRAEVEALSHSD
jgi:predicted transposase/invertase (TIGR01784 family)